MPSRRFTEVNIDIVGPLPPSQGFRYLLTMIDYEEIQEILYPEMNGDTDMMPLFNERLTPVEWRHYEFLHMVFL